jgi:hypothetical protein
VEFHAIACHNSTVAPTSRILGVGLLELSWKHDNFN